MNFLRQITTPRFTQLDIVIAAVFGGLFAQGHILSSLVFLVLMIGGSEWLRLRVQS